MAVLSIPGSISGDFIARYVATAAKQAMPNTPKYISKAVGAAAGYCATAIVNSAVKATASIAAGHAGVIGTFFATKHAARYVLTKSIYAPNSRTTRTITDSLGALMFYYAANQGYKIGAGIGKIAVMQAIQAEKPADKKSSPKEEAIKIEKTTELASNPAVESVIEAPVIDTIEATTNETINTTTENIVENITTQTVSESLKERAEKLRELAEEVYAQEEIKESKPASSITSQAAYGAYKAVGTVANVIVEQVKLDATKIVAAHAIAFGTAVLAQQITKGRVKLTQVLE